MSQSFGVYGLGVMGQNIALNFASHEINCSVFNRSPEKVNLNKYNIFRLTAALKDQRKSTAINS